MHRRFPFWSILSPVQSADVIEIDYIHVRTLKVICERKVICEYQIFLGRQIDDPRISQTKTPEMRKGTGFLGWLIGFLKVRGKLTEHLKITVLYLLRELIREIADFCKDIRSCHDRFEVADQLFKPLKILNREGTRSFKIANPFWIITADEVEKQEI